MVSSVTLSCYMSAFSRSSTSQMLSQSLAIDTSNCFLDSVSFEWRLSTCFFSSWLAATRSLFWLASYWCSFGS